MSKNTIHTNKAPQAIGTYSQAVNHNGLVFISGQIPLIPETMEMISADIEAQIRRAVCLGLLSVSRHVRRLACRGRNTLDRHDGRVSGVARDGIRVGLLPGSGHRTGRILVAGSQFDPVHLYAVQFLPVGAHVSAGHVARALVDLGGPASVEVSGLFSRRRIPGESFWARIDLGPIRRGFLDSLFRWSVSLVVLSRNQTLQRIWRIVR